MWLRLTGVSACCERSNRGKGTARGCAGQIQWQSWISKLVKIDEARFPSQHKQTYCQPGNPLQLFCCDPAGGSQYAAWKQSLYRYPWVPCRMTLSHLAIHPCVCLPAMLLWRWSLSDFIVRTSLAWIQLWSHFLWYQNLTCRKHTLGEWITKIRAVWSWKQC